MEALHTRRKRTGWRNVSQFARATGAEIRQRLLCELVEPARFGVALDLLVESSGLEFLKPSAESRELIRRQFGHSLFDIFEGRHGQRAGWRAREDSNLQPHRYERGYHRKDRQSLMFIARHRRSSHWHREAE